jgi:ABC-type nickel/cobalt efflux system permease component RcnA
MNRLPVLLLGCLLALPAWAADPFRGGGGSSAAGKALAETDVGWLGQLIGEIAVLQRGLNAAISAHLRDLAAGGSWRTLAAVLGLSFLYGVLHAAGPGHGKTVVAAYFVARKEAVWRGLAIGSAISFIQALVAVLLVGALGIVLQWSRLDVTNSAAAVETVSYGLIFLLGCWLLWAAVTGRHHHHHHPAAAQDHSDHAHHHGHDHHHHHDHDHAADRRSTVGIVVAAGMTPCASAIIVMLFALAQQLFLTGVLAVITMALGMALTVSAIGVATIYARRLIQRFVTDEGASETLERVLAGAGALALIIVAGLMTLGAGARLGG